ENAADVLAVEPQPGETIVAVCRLEEIGSSGVTGTIRFTQDGDSVTVEGEVSGLEPGKHGFHVHQEGDLSDKETGKSAGGHFNPTRQEHGRPGERQRHIGDLGNIQVNDDGVAEVNMTDDVISLSGEHSIVGKALVIHAKEDKFTQPSGDAGDRVAFGLIEKE
ncbi:superoxide dismutase family protein, partial [Rhodopirellula bahusiensis]